MVKPVPRGTVVEEYKIGNTRIRICNDAYIKKTPEEIEEQKKRIDEACLRCVLSPDYGKE